MSFSNYPSAIDTTSELPIATDNVTPVKAEVVNRLRDAIIAIESELGTNPSSTYSTVRARLDALKSEIDQLTGGGGGGGSTDLTDVLARLDALESDVGVLQSDVSTLQTDLNTAEATIITNTSNIATNTSNIATNTSNIATNTSNIVTNTSDIATINTILAPKSKIRAYRISDLTNTAPNSTTTISWTSSTRVAAASASISSTQIILSKTAYYLITGQLTFTVNTNSVGGITLDILQDGYVVNTFYDYGATWGIGLNRTINFNCALDITTADYIEVRWQHSGDSDSKTTLVAGDDYSWISAVSLAQI